MSLDMTYWLKKKLRLLGLLFIHVEGPDLKKTKANQNTRRRTTSLNQPPKEKVLEECCV